ncbi:MAG: TIGR03960 family B12-binding radical SAM protein [Thermodesulfobacteriota bacterium]
MAREDLLNLVAKPARYLGGEAGAVVKDPAGVRLSLALVFPEVYEIAMSHLGLKVLYEALAPRPEVAAERVFMPWTDLMDLMDGRGEPPWSLESGRPLGEFDVIGFSLGYELTYTNALHLLRMAGVPLRRAQRGPGHPLVIAGGSAMVNPEPMADFLDLAVVGEAEQAIHELVDLLLAAKAEAWDRPTLYKRAMAIQGVYAPALFEPAYAPDGRLSAIKALDPDHPVVRRRVVADLADHDPPLNRVAPAVAPVHDRLGLEVARGCTRGCRFCQAGYIYRPVRERGPQAVLEAALAAVAATGLEELALLSLSTGDYSCIEPLAAALMDALSERKVALSLPSLRLDSLTPELAAQIKRVRKTGFTMAPEAGSQRLRQVINKNLGEQQIISTTRQVFDLGWNLIKLYFMLGLPGETEEDVMAIGGLASRVARQARARGKRPVVHASLGLFVPKPHTPFQWEGQLDLDAARARLALAKSGINDPRVKSKWNSPEQSVLEGVLSRGDRRLGRALELAVAAGCRFDGWSDQLRYDLWTEALAGAGLDPADYLRPRDPGEVLPWDHIHAGVDKAFLLAERAKAMAAETSGDCRSGRCLDCGACDHKLVKPRLAGGQALAAPPASTPAGEPLAWRFVLQKTGPARFLGHLEMISHLERGFRRAGLNLAHSQGFHPHPLLKCDSALPLGVESLAETLEVVLLGGPGPDQIARRVNAALPAGLSLHQGRPVRPGEGLREPETVTYFVRCAGELDPAALAAFQAAAAAEFIRETPKGRKVIDLKAAVRELRLVEGGLALTVGQAGGRPKPAEVLMAVFGLDPAAAAAARAVKLGVNQGED